MLTINIKETDIDCQSPNEERNIGRKFRVVECLFDNTGQNKSALYDASSQLANKVNPGQANKSSNKRDSNTLIRDAGGGILAESGCLTFINKTFGNIAHPTKFTSSIGQIDIELNKGHTIEVRSSFSRNGVKFAICNDKYNFKNIGRYSNLYKPDEKAKDFFAMVLFETRKDVLFESDTIKFYLIGGSTKEMFKDDKIAYTDDLIAEGDSTKTKTKYRIIKLKDALDIDGFKNYMHVIGY